MINGNNGLWMNRVDHLPNHPAQEKGVHVGIRSISPNNAFNLTRWFIIVAVAFFIPFLSSQGLASDLGLTEADCRCCHGGSLADRHHLLVNTGALECLDCHEMDFNQASAQFEPKLIRDCLQCHTGSLADRHHVLVGEGGFDCFSCHAMVFDSASQSYVPDFNVTCREDQPPPAEAAGSVGGTVSDLKGAPLAWVRVATRDGSQATLSTAAGVYELSGVAPGDYVLDVSLDGYRGTSQTITVVSGQKILADFSLVAIVSPAGVAGVVRDVELAPVAGARVFSENSEFSTLSKADGTFALVDMVAGSYLLTAEKNGFESSAQAVTLTQGQTLGLDFILNALRVENCADALDNNSDGLIDCDDPLCAQDAICREAGVEVCGDGLDNDANGLVDCDDSTCAETIDCQPPVAESCSDGVDNDGDGLKDCADPACGVTSQCLPPPIEICDDGIDNDANGLIDCSDAKCLGFLDCQPPRAGEYCGNGVDDNGDGLIDCIDPLCGSDPACLGEICGNGLDDNGDGLLDCADPQCEEDSLCLTGGGFEICTNLIDDDGNGLLDCDDPVCSETPMCRAPVVESCDNGRDDDRDGLIDCADPECASYLFCNGSSRVEVCDNGLDDDADGRIDCKDKDCKKTPLCPKPGNGWGRTWDKAAL